MLPISLELYRYWVALKARRGAPERCEVEPGAIRAILGDTFMLDFDDADGFPLRIAGSKANALFLRELRGLPFLDIWRSEDRADLRRALWRAADDVRPVLLTGLAQPPGLEPAQIEALLLPLRHGGSAHSRMLGALALEAAPQWFGLVGAGPVALVDARAVEDSEADPGALAGAAGFGRPFPRRSLRAGAAAGGR